MTLFGLHPRKCKCCGKKFEAVDEWVYKIRLFNKNGHEHYMWFCSWKCLQAFRKAG